MNHCIIFHFFLEISALIIINTEAKNTIQKAFKELVKA